MPRLRSVYYRVPFAGEASRRHVVPLDAARHLLDEPGALPSCLHAHRVLAQVTLIAGDRVLSTSGEVVLSPSAENEVSFPAEWFRSTPASATGESYLVVRLVLLTGPAGHEHTPEI